MKTAATTFPKDFVWGGAAAAYQIEGAAREDGRGLSVWDMMCRRPGAVFNGHTGDVACDHYRRWRGDVQMMKRMGLQAYRFSVSWPRVLPEGTGKVNAKGLDFYDRLVDGLLAAGIQPFLTLFHWDYPHALYCRGGWLNRDSADWFAEYTRVLAERLSDRVRHWMTHNEPQCFVALGHQTGRHAPGDKLALNELARIGHHALLAHGRAVQALRQTARRSPCVGIAPVGLICVPASDRPADVRAAHSATFSIQQEGSIFWRGHFWLDPIFFGRYPADALDLLGRHRFEFPAGDMKIIAQPLDFLGLNVYGGDRVGAKRGGGFQSVTPPPGAAQNALKWYVEPDALYYSPLWYTQRYKTPIYITENGLANLDWPSLDGKVHDPQRIDFTRRYLLRLRDAVRDGADVRGYFHWSIMDNFEWAEGYKERFGLVYVDYATQRRTPKDSAAWYRRVIRSNGGSLGRPGLAAGRPGE